MLVATNHQSSIHTATASHRGWYSRKLLCWGARRIPDHAKVCSVLQSLAQNCCGHCRGNDVALLSELHRPAYRIIMIQRRQQALLSSCVPNPHATPHSVPCLLIAVKDSIHNLEPISHCVEITAQIIAQKSDHSLIYTLNKRRACYLLLLFTPASLTAPFAVGLGLQRQRWLDLVVWTLERAGPAFIKWGQWAATRPDLFPPDLCSKLAQLQTGAPTHPFAYTRQAVELAFGCVCL